MRRALWAVWVCAVWAGVAVGQERSDLPYAVGLLEGVQPSVVKVYGAGGFQGVPSYGTGVVVATERGTFAVTAWSISLRTDSLRVVTTTGRRYGSQQAPVELWDYDPGLGLALLKLPGSEGMEPMTLTAVEAEVGQEVYALGNPFNVIYGSEDPGVLRGVVMGVGAVQREGVEVLRFPDRLERAVLTDIPNNPGMQGGPLVSREGAWLGVIGRIVESRSTNTTLTFAVPMDVVRAFVLEAAALDEARLRPALPPRTGEAELRVDTGLRLQRTHLRNASLAYIERVVRGSAAEAAGVRADDLVFRVGRRTVHDTDDYDEAMRARSPGEQVEVWVKRGRQVLRFEWTLEAR